MELTFLLDAGSSITPHCSIMSRCLSLQSLVSKLPHHLPLLQPLSCCIDDSAQSTIKMLYNLAIVGIDYLYTLVFASRTILLICTSPLLYINNFVDCAWQLFLIICQQSVPINILTYYLCIPI